MFRIQAGKFCGANIAFSPPELYNLDLRQNEYLDNECIRFVSVDGSVKITVCLEKQAAGEEISLKEFARDCGYYRLTDFVRIKRGNRYGLGAYYGKTEYTATAYREVHNFKLNEFLENQVSVMVTANEWRLKEINPVYAVLGIPQVKAFLDSLEYFG